MKINEITTSARKVNVAVVGLGFMGVTHLRAYLALESARVVAVCDAARLPVNGILRGVVGNVKTDTNDIDLGPKVQVCRVLEEVLANPEVELVDICTPTPLHPVQSIAALKAGRHVLCEKPLARTSAAAREILQASQSSSSFLMPAMCMRFWPGWSWLKQMTAEQTYGKILAARFRRVSERPAWSAQGTYTGGMDIGGALFDLHIHDTDFVSFLFGRPSAVFSTGVVGGTDSVDHVVTQYMFSGGPVVSAEGGWLLTKGFNMSFTIHCERATLDFDLARGADAMQISEQGQIARSVHYDFPDGYGAEIRYMLACVASGRPPEIVDARAGVTALEICEAEEKSIRTGAVASL
jgi:predicted dehydrogenase